MRRLGLLLFLIFLCWPAGAQGAAETGEKPNTSPSMIKVEPDWNAVRNAEGQGQILSLEALQNNSGARLQRQNETTEFITEFTEYVSRSKTINVPVLIPKIASFAEQTNLVTGATFYNFSVTYANDIFVSVLGMCSGVRLPEDHPMLAALRRNRTEMPVLSHLGVPYRLSKTEFGHQLSFSAFGCAYEVSLTCQDECNAEKGLITIASSLGVINAR